MHSSKSKFRSFERLESRYAFAGNVTASIDGSGNLLILGDSLSNGVSFTETSTGKFALTGIDAGAGATTINGGAPNNTVNLTGITGSVTFRMLNGDDEIQIPYFNYGGWMIINSGDGNDVISLGSDAKASYLVGVLSIRTQKGADRIDENNINVIGNQDLGAAQTDEADVTDESAKPLYFTITNSTFGSFLYFNFGGRAGGLTMNNTVQAGDVYIYNQIIIPGTDLLHREKIIEVGEAFTFNYNNSSMGGSLTYRSTASSTISTVDSIVLENADIYSVGSNSVNLMTFTGGSFGSLSTDTFDTYFVATGHESGYLVSVKSAFDNIKLTNVYCTGDLDLQSNGLLTLDGVTGQSVVLTNNDNDGGVIHVGTSHFEFLLIGSGAVGEFHESSIGDTNRAELISTIVDGSVTIDAWSREKPVRVTSPIVQTQFRYNQSAVTYDFTTSSIGSILMSAVPVEGVPQGAPGGPMTINVNSSVVGATDLILPTSNDTINFAASTVSLSTLVDGGGGTNTFINSGSNLNILAKKNF